MRKAFAVSLAILLCLSAIALAADKNIQGTITRLDTNQKMLVVKDTSGNETTVYWNDATKISGGELKEGASVQLSASDHAGNLTATSIQVKTSSSNKPY